MKQQIAIIGSGVAGLASAIRLAKQGFEVTVFEKNDFAGGKMNEIRVNGYRFDTGPSVLTLPELFTDLIKTAGFNPDDFIKLHKLDNTCRYFYSDGTILNAYSDPVKFASEASRQTGEPEENIMKYLEHSRELYDLTADTFIFKPFHKLKTFNTPEAKKIARKWKKLDSFTTMHKRNAKCFTSDKLVQLFDRYATYNGSNPFKAPATLNIISHLEHNLGSYLPAGGMRQIISTMLILAEKLGIDIRLNSRVERVITDRNKIRGIQVNGNTEYFDIVVSNADIHYFRQHLLRSKNTEIRKPGYELSSSAIIFYWGMKKKFAEFDTHNILFSKNYKEEFDYIFKYKTLYSDPTVYIYISSKLNPGDAPEGRENWFCMINSSHIEGHCWEPLIQKVRKTVIDKINKTLFYDISEYIGTESIMHPHLIEQATLSYKGALYGPSSNSRFSAFLRQPNFSRRIKGLYFAGGSVHPGGGVPLCLASAKIVADLIDEKHGKKNTR